MPATLPATGISASRAARPSDWDRPASRPGPCDDGGTTRAPV